MKQRTMVVGLALGVASVAGLAAPAGAAASLTPRAGSYTGQEAASPTPEAVHFTVTNGPKTIRSFTGSGQVKAGCKNTISSYEAPPGPMKVTKAGHFSESLTTYPGPAVRITVTGHFTTGTKVVGHITTAFKKVKGCNATRSFTAKRS
jgi:hypothetical protein